MDKTMKKIFTLILTIVALSVLASCDIDNSQAFKDRYNDPSKTTTVSCDKLMTGTFMLGNGYTYNAYWRMYTWDNYFGKLAQTIGFSVNSGSMYYINDGYANDRWNSFYDILRNYRIMQRQYDSEAADQQADDRIFLALTEVYLYDHLSQIVDIFGPVPFEKACYLAITGDLASSYPAYDNDVDLYKMMLEKLDALYDEIGGLANSISKTAQASLLKQDYICGGDLTMWQRYANALLLRLGVHVAAQGALTTEGKAAVAKAAGRMLPSTWAESIKVHADFDSFAYWENFRDSWKDINATASQKVIDAFQVSGSDDPRLAVVYFPNEEGKYYGMHVGETSDEQNDHTAAEEYEKRYYARLNYATFTYNNLFVSPIFSAAESWFLLAEAYQQGYATGDAKDAFVRGIAASIEQYYDENVNGSQEKATSTEGRYFKKFNASDIPSEEDALAFAETIWNAYSNKLEAIMTQKWAHFGITQPTQAWTDIRRTGYPKLDYPTDTGTGVKYPNIVNRVKYPNTEAANNKANYTEAKANVGDDSENYTLFWAKSLK